MAFTKKFANDGVTICATIHSPSPFAFSLFDRVLMLVRGEIVYFGDRGKKSAKYPCFKPRVLSDLCCFSVLGFSVFGTSRTFSLQHIFKPNPVKSLF